MNSGHLQIRFRKVSHGLILREKRAQASRVRKGAGVAGEAGEEEEEPPDENTPPDHIQQLRYFQNVSGYSGVGGKKMVEVAMYSK